MITKLSAIVTKISSTNGLDSDRQGVEKKILDVDENITNTIGLVKENDYNTKVTDIENKIPTVIGWITTTVLNTKAKEIENKIPDIPSLLTKAALNTKATEIKYIIPAIINLVTKDFLNTNVTDRDWKKTLISQFLILARVPQTSKKKCFDARMKKGRSLLDHWLLCFNPWIINHAWSDQLLLM